MLQTAKVLQGPAFTPSFVPTSPAKGRKAKAAPPVIVSGIDRKGDAKLWKLHDEFCREYETFQKLDTPAAQEGSGPRASASEKRAFKKWEDQLQVVDKIAKRISAAQAFTLDGLLMKIQVTGHLLEAAGKTYEFRPYQSHEGLWQPMYGTDPRSQYFDAKYGLIATLRDGLLRLHARGGSR